MNTLRNKVHLMGRLGAQPEIKKFETGKTLARFTIATHESYKSKSGEWKEETQWHVLNAWGKTAERVEKLLSKGQEVLIEGKLVYQSYETTAGVKKYNTIIDVAEFILLKNTPKEVAQEIN